MSSSSFSQTESETFEYEQQKKMCVFLTLQKKIIMEWEMKRRRIRKNMILKYNKKYIDNNVILQNVRTKQTCTNIICLGKKNNFFWLRWPKTHN